MTDTQQPRRRGRPPNPAGPTTGTERNRVRRAAIARAGGRRLDILLAPPAASALDALCAASGTSATDAVSDALLRAAAGLGGPA